MDGYLKATTAVVVVLGPYVSTDGITAKANLKVSAGTVQISKNGTAWANKTYASYGLSATGGWYYTKLSSADVDTPGVLAYKSAFTATGPVFGTFTILPKTIYSAWFATGYTPVNVIQVEGVDATNQLSTAVGANKGGFAAGIKSLGVNYVASVGLVKKANPNVVSAGVIATGAITNAKYAAGAISAGTLVAGTLTNVKFAAGALSGGTLTATAKSSIGTATWATTVRTLTSMGPVKVGANGLSAAGIATGAITNAKFAAGALSAGVFKSTSIPGQGAPPAATDMLTQSSYLYKFMRNKTVVSSTAGTVTVYADNGSTADHKASITDAAGVFTRLKFITGA